MCADCSLTITFFFFSFFLDASRGTDGDLSGFYGTAGNQRPLGKSRAVRNAQGDRGRELDISSVTDNMTHVVVRSEPPPSQPFHIPPAVLHAPCRNSLTQICSRESSAWYDFVFVQKGCENKPSMSACCGVFSILWPILSLFTWISLNKNVAQIKSFVHVSLSLQVKLKTDCSASMRAWVLLNESLGWDQEHPWLPATRHHIWSHFPGPCAHCFQYVVYTISDQQTDFRYVPFFQSFQLEQKINREEICLKSRVRDGS